MSRGRGFGSVRKLPSGRYQARYTGPDGLERTGETTYRTKSEARSWLAGVETDLSRGHWHAPEGGRMRFGTYLDTWLAGRVDLAPGTRQLYADLRARWFDDPLPSLRPLVDVELRHLTPALIRQWHATASTHAADRIRSRAVRRPRGEDAQARAWARSQGQPVPASGRLSRAVVEDWRAAGAPVLDVPTRTIPDNAGRAQVAQAYRLLRAVLATAVTDGAMRSNPCQVPGAGSFRHAERRPATLDELQAIVGATLPRYRAAVVMAAWSGLRGGELAALTRDHIDLDAQTVRVERTLLELRGQQPGFGPPKTAGSVRTVNLPRFVVEALATHLEEYVPDDPGALVFTSSVGGPFVRARRSAALTPGRRAVNRPELRWHDLRHTGATLAAATGASLADLMARLGHASPRAALIYQHASAEGDRLIAQRLDELASGNVVSLAERRAAG